MTDKNVFEINEDILDFRIDGNKVKELIKDGMTPYEVAAMYSVSVDLIEAILRD